METQPVEAPEGATDPLEILVVDDNAADRIAVDAALEEVDANITNVRSGLEALHQLLERDFVLILLDVEMPTMDGLACARMIRSRHRNKHIPIIFITAHSQTDARVREGYGLGAVDFLFKPVVPEVLRAKVKVFLDLARQAEQLRDHEKRESQRVLAEERYRWEQISLQRQVEEQTRVAEALAREAEALAHIVKEREATQIALARMNAELTDALDQARAARETAERASRLKTEFLGLISHELRTPLAALQLQIERLRVEAPEPEQMPMHINRMWSSSMRLHELIESLLEHARLEAGRMRLEVTSFPIDALLRDAVRPISVDAERKKIEVEVDAPADLPLLATDRRVLRLLLSNLLENAVKFTERGKVTMRVRTDGDHVTIAVSDTGRGIPRDEQSRIFEPFSHIEPMRGKHARGMGLGLALVRELATALGGSIALDSEVGRGTTFTVRVPIGVPPSSPPPSA
jgi:signal transduction histidine kinase